MTTHAHITRAVGRRKTSVARVTLKPGAGKIIVNRRALETYFGLETQRSEVMMPFSVTGTEGKYDTQVNVRGGGLTGQAGAIKLGISRALVSIQADLRIKLRQHALLTRDPRMVERKKYGLRKARKRFQFSKR